MNGSAHARPKIHPAAAASAADARDAAGPAHAAAPPAAGLDLEATFREHGGWLLDFLRRRFGPREAEDLAQETFARAAGAQPQLRHPRAFLARVAINAARDAARRRAARPQYAPEDAAPAAGLPSHQSETVLLKQVILSLPPHLRETFVLSRFGGLTYEEIAQRCGVSVKTIEGRMTKALALCAAALRD
ncbi:RNA polymerase sigma factor [Phenylobacterium deserti]|uniref:RNA polymerase sigma factor n=1 Tax=Phenylobacterium deserti TaxID=1914756 RepID=UPI0014041B45|nr:RNA polymerase sigma factor [Phenylobacterium deserti]